MTTVKYILQYLTANVIITLTRCAPPHLHATALGTCRSGATRDTPPHSRATEVCLVFI